ncbi:hypothetical protein HDV06_006545 [Boothiomyces sp. JEL0866]|nr:hypothetical protein HDV06_006545 [Boothiomyces sp. JEL0866]
MVESHEVIYLHSHNALDPVSSICTDPQCPYNDLNDCVSFMSSMDSADFSHDTDTLINDTETKLAKSILLEKYLMDESSKKRKDFYPIPRELYVIPEEEGFELPKRICTSFDMEGIFPIPLLYMHSHDPENPLQNICKDLECPVNSAKSDTESTVKTSYIEKYLNIQSRLMENGSNFDEIDVYSSISNQNQRRKRPPPVPKKPLHLTAAYFQSSSESSDNDRSRILLFENESSLHVRYNIGKRKQDDLTHDTLTDEDVDFEDVSRLDSVEHYRNQFVHTRSDMIKDYIPAAPANPLTSVEDFEPMEKYRVRMGIAKRNQVAHSNIPVPPPNPLDVMQIESMQRYRKQMGIIDKEEVENVIIDPSKIPVAPPNPLLVPPPPPNPLLIPKPPMNPLLVPKKWYRNPKIDALAGVDPYHIL